jgi:poly(beta-D-mannuronate) lyase
MSKPAFRSRFGSVAFSTVALLGAFVFASCVPTASTEESHLGASGGGSGSPAKPTSSGGGGQSGTGPTASGGQLGNATGGSGGEAGARSGGSSGDSGGSGGQSSAGGSSAPGDAGFDAPVTAGPSDGGPVATTDPLPDKLPPCVRSLPAADVAALNTLLTTVQPGDCLLLADGTSMGFTVSAKGSAEKPVVIRAANRGKAVIDGGNITMMGAAYVVIEGFSFTGMASAIAQSSDRCRITRSRFQSGVARANGTSRYTRIDHNEFGPKSSGDGHYIHATEMSEFTQMDHNYLHDATGAGMSRDAASLGCCGPAFDYHDTGNVFEFNLLVNCSSDAEYISIKSSSNTIRYNTFRKNGGTLTLRAGRKNQIYGNYFLGGGGIRAYEDDHKIFNNYVETGTALDASGTGGGHAPLKNATIVHNTFIGGVNISGTGHRIANNIGGGGGTGNLSVAAAGLVRKGEIMAITATSAAVDKAVGTFDFVVDDVQGQARSKADVGADEWSTEAELPLRRPLMPADVGVEAP